MWKWSFWPAEKCLIITLFHGHSIKVFFKDVLQTENKKNKKKEKALLPKSPLKFFKSLGTHYVFTKFAAGDVS